MKGTCIHTHTRHRLSTARQQCESKGEVRVRVRVMVEVMAGKCEGEAMQ